MAILRFQFLIHLLGGVTLLCGQGQMVEDAGRDGPLYRHHARSAQKPSELTAVPYYTGNNRARYGNYRRRRK